MTYRVRPKHHYDVEKDTVYAKVECPINPQHRLTPLPLSTTWTTRWACEDCGLEFMVDYTPEGQTA